MAKPNTRGGKTDWKRLEGLQDLDIRRAAKSDPDAAPVVSNQWFQQARLWDPQRKTPVSLRLDEAVVKWFRARGRGYQTRINAVLRAYVESHVSK